MLKWMIASCALLASTGLSAAGNCPEFKPGEAYPWHKSELMPGDQWAYLYVDVDEKGRPKDCRVGKHQYKPEMGFWFCRAAMGQGDFEPIMKDGVAIEGTVTRFISMPGRQRERAEEAARKQWFKDHPQERPSCYPR